MVCIAIVELPKALLGGMTRPLRARNAHAESRSAVTTPRPTRTLSHL